MVSMELTGKPQSVVSAKDLNLVSCTRCAKVWPISASTCGRCGHKLVSRNTLSLSRVWALWVIGFMCYIPANVFPMLKTRTLFQEDDSTIIGGAVELAHYGNYGIAAIIIFASVFIPLGKFWAVAYLAISIKSGSRISMHRRQIMYEVVEYIGRWSMIDIFVVAIMSALVQLNTLATINPGPASIFFALSVIFTMLSAQAFDPRTIWDAEVKDGGPGRNE